MKIEINSEPPNWRGLIDTWPKKIGAIVLALLLLSLLFCYGFGTYGPPAHTQY